MQTLRPSQVPEYLRNSKFFLGLNTADDDAFSIPLSHMKLNLNVYSLAEMTELLNTIRFWGSDVFPRALINFAARRKYAVIKSVLEPYRDDLQIICTACSLIGEVAGNELRLEKAMDSGNLDIVRYFNKKGTNFTTNAIALAAGKGALDCLQYAMNFQNVASYGHGIFLEAVRNGRMDSILFLQEKGFTLHLNCYYDNRNSKIKRVDLAEIAASSGQLDVLKYLHSQGCSLSWTATAAAEAGHWDCLEYAIQNGARLRGEYHSVGTLTIAQRLARARLLKLFPLALSRAGAIDERTTLNFAKMKKWELFQLCIQYITQTSLSLIFVAAEQGYIECLQRLYELSVSEVEASGNGLNWLTCAASHSTRSGLSFMDLALSAATANHWECLTFLITHGCPMPKSLTTVLAKAGQQELYLLATDRGCEVSVQAACYFARDGNLDLLQHALMHRCERSEEILKAAARHGQLPCLMYAHAQGCPLTAQVTLAAARGGHRECLQYLYKHGCPSSEHVRSALRKRSIPG